MRYDQDSRIVLTLDAGGTNLVFSAVQCNREIISPIVLPAQGDDLEACLANITAGFSAATKQLPDSPVAISFAFPGPGDFLLGIIGDLSNLPGFRGGVALGPMLEAQFDLPVFISNDGDLFALGEAIAGFLPYVNSLLERNESPKRFRNLLGVTFGTGFGAGIVSGGVLLLGDNSSCAEIYAIRSKLDRNMSVEEGVSIRGVRRTYAQKSGISLQECPEPKHLFEIAQGSRGGNQEAAREAFRRMGEIAGDAIANSITMIDGLVVIGGGLAGAAEFFLPALMCELNGNLDLPDGRTVPRMPIRAFNLEDESQVEPFVRGDLHTIRIPGTDKTVLYDRMMRIGVGLSKLGTSQAVGIGAYAFALQSLDRLTNGRRIDL
jgi:glucokinase